MLVACWVIRVTALENAAASANATATITSQISFPSRLHRPDIGPDNPRGWQAKTLAHRPPPHEKVYYAISHCDSPLASAALAPRGSLRILRGDSTWPPARRIRR